MTQEIATVLDFWLGPLDDAGMPRQDRNALWFKYSEDTDRRCGEHFGARVQQALAGELDHWAQDDSGLVALVILLDQLTRNIYRGTPGAFSGDAAALALAQHAIATGRYQQLPAIHQVLLYMPLEHAENLDTQEQCVQLFAALAAATGNPQIAEFGRFARAHRDVIAHFDRFPHRNPILGRDSSEVELAYLEQHGGF